MFYLTNKKPTTTVFMQKGLLWPTEVLLDGQRDVMGGEESNGCSGREAGQPQGSAFAK